jgi:outer membrane lipoprotein LolB
MSVRMTVAAGSRPLRLVCLIVAGLLLAGCQSAPKPIAPNTFPAQVAADWPARKAQLQARAQYIAQGRIGVAAGADGFNGRLRWVQEGMRSTVSLDGPLGIGGVRIVNDAGALTLTTASGEALDSQAAHDELVRRMGFEPPLNSLRYWLQGVPDPASPSTETPDAQGYLGSLVQSDWTVTFTGYMQTPEGALPQKLTVARANVRVRLIIESWRAP